MILLTTFLILVDLDREGGEDKGGLSLLDAAVCKFSDLLLFYVQVLHEVLAVPSKKLIARGKHVVVINIEVKTTEEIGVNFFLKVHLESS